MAMQKESPDEKNNPIQTMVGNGLRPDVWDVFRQRFKIPRITEFYGSSEGNAFFINLLNKDKTMIVLNLMVITTRKRRTVKYCQM